MNLLSRTQHAYLDLATVAVFALAPVVLSLEGGAAALSYALAVFHLAMSLVTAGLPIAGVRLIPLPLHGLIEATAGVVLGLVGWLAFEDTAQAFYLAIAAVILFVFAISPYTGESV